MAKQRTPRTLARVVEDYVNSYREPAAAEMEFYAGFRTLTAVIDWAGLGRRPDGLRHDHQRRIPKLVLKRATAQLLKASLRKSRTFDELLNRVRGAIGTIHGVGELLVYDTALRIGAQLGLTPDLVYLHAGTRSGARALGLPTAEGFLDPADLPSAFKVLTPREIEDCLCIFKSELPKL